MFTGIIETMGLVKNISKSGDNLDFSIESSWDNLQLGQSIAHNGVCLTVTGIQGNAYNVTAIAETLRKTNLGRLQTGDYVNLERCLQAGGRLDGHIVQGHVDTTGTCTEVIENNGSHDIVITYTPAQGFITVPKGSITLNGVSLTVVRSETGLFSVSIIPYTFQHTNFQHLQPGDTVNLEFDIIGKYLSALALPYLKS